MYLIYVSARHERLDREPPSREMPQDLQPVMLALNCKKLEYLMREAKSRSRKIPKPEGCEDVDRIFVKLRRTECSEDCESLYEILEQGKAQLAIGLATVFFGKGSAEPVDRQFSRYVRDRSRVADRVLVTGYTDKNCTLAVSERIGMERARAVRRILEDDGLECPVVAISRASAAYATHARWSRRVEITALFHSTSRGGGGDSADGGPDGGEGERMRGYEPEEEETKAPKAPKARKPARKRSPKRKPAKKAGSASAPPSWPPPDAVPEPEPAAEEAEAALAGAVL